jgi:hypothetical protein
MIVVVLQPSKIKRNMKKKKRGKGTLDGILYLFLFNHRAVK